MANQEHYNILKKGGEVWNKWRDEQPEIIFNFSKAGLIGVDLRRANLQKVDLSGADLFRSHLNEANLSGAILSKAFLTDADLRGAILSKANLSGADLTDANLSGADLNGANLSKAILRKANLSDANLTHALLEGANLNGTILRMANLYEADLSGADLRKADLYIANLYEAHLHSAKLMGADLRGVNLVKAHLEEANLTGCRIYGIAAWNLSLKNTIQSNLIITPEDEPSITLDNLQVAQFVYLLLNNQEIREAIDTITSKVVLILGSFTKERKKVLDVLREELRKRNYLPVLFDFDKPANRDITETVSTLAHMARFVIADITDAKSIPQELMVIVPNLPSVPVQPLILNSQHEYGMFEHFKWFPWVLPVYRYTDEASLLNSLKVSIIDPAEEKAKELGKP